MKIRFVNFFLIRRIISRSKPNSDFEVAFLCRDSHQVTIKGQSLKFDRVLDPFYNAINTITQCKMFVLGIPKSKKYYFPKKYLARPSHFPAMRLSGIAESGLEEELDEWQIDKLKFSKLIFRAEKDFSAGYASAKKLFHANTKMKFLFTSVWYSAETMGYIAAAHDIGVRVVEVQHAAEIYKHVMYFDWTKTPVGGFELSPDLFMMWNNECAKIVQNSFSGGRKNTAIVAGYPWHDFYKLFNNIEAPITSDFQHPKRVLFTLQGPTFEGKKRVPDFIIDFMQQDRRDVHINFRCHPNDFNAKKEIKDLARLNLKTKFEVTSGGDDLIESLSRCNYHITSYSTVCYEAQIYGVPTLLFGSESAELYRREIDEGIFQWTDGSAFAVEQFLATEHGTKEQKHELKSSLRLLKESLKEVIYAKP